VFKSLALSSRKTEISVYHCSLLTISRTEFWGVCFFCRISIRSW